MVSHISVMPRRSMPLPVTRSDRASALSCMERALTVPRQGLYTPGPGLRLTSPASKLSKKNSNSSQIWGGGRFLLS